MTARKTHTQNGSGNVPDLVRSRITDGTSFFPGDVAQEFGGNDKTGHFVIPIMKQIERAGGHFEKRKVYGQPNRSGRMSYRFVSEALISPSKADSAKSGTKTAKRSSKGLKRHTAALRTKLLVTGQTWDPETDEITFTMQDDDGNVYFFVQR